MSRETWNLIKLNKNFNVHMYRRGVTALIVSLGMSCVIGILLFYKYTKQPEPDFYATNGATPPIMLKPMLAPNSSTMALLDPDPPTMDYEVKVIPQ